MSGWGSRWAQRTRGSPGPSPGPGPPPRAREVLPKLVSVSLKQAPQPPHLLPPPHAVTSFGFRAARIREVTVIPYSRWLTTAKPHHRGHRFRNPTKLVPSCLLVDLGGGLWRWAVGRWVVAASIAPLCHLLPSPPSPLGLPLGASVSQGPSSPPSTRRPPTLTLERPPCAQARTLSHMVTHVSSPFLVRESDLMGSLGALRSLQPRFWDPPAQCWSRALGSVPGGPVEGWPARRERVRCLGWWAAEPSAGLRTFPLEHSRVAVGSAGRQRSNWEWSLWICLVLTSD